ncbi:major facilitator superfamily domain-containing protein [Coemansia spiralis]|nr:major facilitator superfamily domain-containing protein [Coemansia spiralis]KAI9506987.1 major facilitator superfamily domain-containing protein [Coemansia spiralis]
MELASEHDISDSTSNNSSNTQHPKPFSRLIKKNATFADAEIELQSILDSSSLGTCSTQEIPSLLQGKRLYLALAGLDALLFLAALDLTIIATVYVEIANSFNALSRAEWTITSYMLAATAIQPIYGKFSDILGRAEAIVVSVVLFVLGSVLCAVSRSMEMLIASRAVQGLGGGGIMSLIFVVVADVLSERDRGKYIGIFTCTWGLASAVAPILGGVIVQRSDWRIIFWINLPFCAVALLLVLFFMRLPKPAGSIREKAAKIDGLGSTLFLLGTVPLLLGLSWGGREYSWVSPLVLGCLGSGALMLAVFMLVEWKIPSEPIVPSRLLAVRNVALSALGHLFFGAAGYGPIVFVPQWALLVRGASAISAGIHLLPFTVGSVITSVLGGFIMSRTGRYRRLIVIGAILLCTGNGLLVLLDRDTSLGLQIGILFLCGLGAGACIQPIMMAAQAAVEGHDMAAATTLCAFLRSLGGILCVAILSSIMHSVIKKGLTRIALAAPRYIFTIVQVAENQAVIYSPGVSEELRSMVVAVYMKSMRLAFFALLPFSGALVLSTLGYRHIELNRQRKKTIN